MIGRLEILGSIKSLSSLFWYYLLLPLLSVLHPKCSQLVILQTERIDDKAAAQSAARIESTAYAAAETAGSGALREYANKAAELVLAELQQKSVAGAPPSEAKAPSNVVRAV